MEISSAQNPKIKYASRLRNRHFRDEEKKTLLEGYRAVCRACEVGFPMETCFYCPELFLGTNEHALLLRLEKAGVSLCKVSRNAFMKLAYRDRPEGLIAIAPFLENKLSKLPQNKNGLYIVAESIEKPGNLGAMLRTADGAGADGFIVCDKRTDIYNPNVITASTGAVFTMPVAECSQEDAFQWLKNLGIRLLAASPHAQKIYSESDMRSGVAVLLGAEQFGLSQFWNDRADEFINIPMSGLADSLNVGIATAILLFEAARQRGWPKRKIAG